MIQMLQNSNKEGGKNPPMSIFELVIPKESKAETVNMLVLWHWKAWNTKVEHQFIKWSITGKSKGKNRLHCSLNGNGLKRDGETISRFDNSAYYLLQSFPWAILYNCDSSEVLLPLHRGVNKQKKQYPSNTNTEARHRHIEATLLSTVKDI